jgi:hypothetical protein
MRDEIVEKGQMGNSAEAEAKALMKKHKVDTIYSCNGYWFIDEAAAENYAREIKRKYETYKMK